MENINDIIPFAKDMLRQRPTSSMLKIYMLGRNLICLKSVLCCNKLLFSCKYTSMNHFYRNRMK
uniref:Uncharacterized protein n=1 Tax=Cyprinodon variegatus TaxID=28743 RepID=A0A3Q2DPU4_CYPVA